MAAPIDTLTPPVPATAPEAEAAVAAAPPRKTRRLLVVDALRAVAAISVLVHHLPPFTGPLVFLRPWQAIGFIGVGLFLVLSGFSIHYKWALTRNSGVFNQRIYWRRRFTRIYPSYLAAAVLAVVVAASAGVLDHPVAPWGHGKDLVPWSLAWLSQGLVVTANVIPIPTLFIAWTIALEFQLYAAYSGVVKFAPRFDPMKIVFWALGIALIWRIGAQFIVTSVPASGFLPDGNSPLESRVFYSQMPARCFEWFLGVLAAEALVGNVKLPRWTRSIALSAFLLLAIGALHREPQIPLSLAGHDFYLTDVLFDLVVGVAFFVLLNWMIAHEGSRVMRAWQARPLRFAAFLGLFSYSIYLVHHTVFVFWEHYVGWSSQLALLVEGVVAIAVAWLFYMAVERHFLKR